MSLVPPFASPARLVPLRYDETGRWSDLFRRHLKIGVELELAHPSGKDSRSSLAQLRKSLMTGDDFFSPGETGIYDIQKEHCGLEIRVVGWEPHFDTLVRQYGVIVRPILEGGYRVLGTTGMHHHLIYFAPPKPIPEIIIANVYSLVLWYAPVLRFMTSTGPSRDRMTRKRKHTSHLVFVENCPCRRSVRDIQDIFRTDYRVPQHQHMLNLERLPFDEAGNALRFWLEMRFPEVDLAPTSIAAKQILFLALVLKAVDLSAYGLLDPCSGEKHMSDVRRLIDLLSNSRGRLAYSDTSGLTDGDIDFLRGEAANLLGLLAGKIRSLSPRALDVLRFLARKPISLLRNEGLSWEEIEELMASRAERPKHPLLKRLIFLLDTGEIANCKSEAEWIESAAARIGEGADRVRECLASLADECRLFWDESLGTLTRS